MTSYGCRTYEDYGNKEKHDYEVIIDKKKLPKKEKSDD